MAKPKVVIVDININSKPGGRNYSPLAAVCEEKGYDLQVYDLREPDEIVEVAHDADAIVTCYTKIDHRILDRCPNLKVAVRAAVGPDVFDLEDCTAANIPACNIPDYSTEEVAVQTITLALAVLRMMPLSNKLVHNGGWDVNCTKMARRVSTLKMGFVGFGRIARKAAEYAKAFGFDLYAYDPYLSAEACAQAGAVKLTKEELFKTCDVICVNAPQTEETYHTIDKAAVAMMKDGVTIVNTGRGGLIETQAIIDGLKNGKIAGVGLDVIEEEPLRDANAEILQFDNVLITSHTGYSSQEARIDQYRKVGETIVACFNGELPYNCLNKQALLEKRGQK